MGSYSKMSSGSLLRETEKQIRQERQGYKTLSRVALQYLNWVPLPGRRFGQLNNATSRMIEMITIKGYTGPFVSRMES